MNRRLLPAALLMAAIGLIMALVTGQARDTLIMPIVSAIWALGALIESLPQLAVWWVLVTLCVIMVLRSVSDTPVLRLRERLAVQRGGRVEDWSRAVRLAGHDEYARWRLSQRLGLLATELIAERHRIDLRQARRILEQHPELPADVRRYFQAGFAAQRMAPRRLGLPARKLSPNDPLNLDPARVLDAIEQLMQSA